MFYSLAHIEESYLEKNLIKFIALAPCSIGTGWTFPDGKPDVDHYKNGIFKFQDEGIYSFGGPNWDQDLKTICDKFD